MSAVDLDDVQQLVSDVDDVLFVIQAALNAAPAELTAIERDALATVARLGQERASAARNGLGKMIGGARG